MPRTSEPPTDEDYGEWQTLHDELVRYARKAREQGKEHVEEAAMRMLDSVTGWCSPHMRLDP